MSDPRGVIARWRAEELAIEAGVPPLVAGGLFALAVSYGSAPGAAAPLTPLEETIPLAALAATVGWATARTRWLAGERDPKKLAFWGAAAGVAVILGLAQAVASGFASACTDTFQGAIVPYDDVSICVRDGVPDNPWLRGTVLRMRWTAVVPLPMLPLYAVAGLLAAVGLAHRRLLPSRLPVRATQLLDWLPGQGLASAVGDVPKDGRIQACRNHTWWGTLCGQIYAADKVFAPGEWCVRCRQPFRRDGTMIAFDVVLPVTDDVVTLNAMERVDADTWDPGHPLRAAHASVSGTARWVIAGTVHLPSVLPFNQGLAIVHTLLPTWKGRDAPTDAAIAMAIARASRVVGWVWTGDVRGRLHRADPTRDLLLVRGAVRLGQVVEEATEALAIQLECGCLPVELRAGYLHQRLPDTPGGAAASLRQNLRIFTWIPTASAAVPEAGPGVWLPRLEGEALRRWLSFERIGAKELLPGATRPAPYTPLTPPRVVVLDPGGELAAALSATGSSAELAHVRTPGELDGRWDLAVVWLDGEDGAAIEAARKHATRVIAVAANVAAPAGVETWAWPLLTGDAEALLAEAARAVQTVEATGPLDIVRRPLRGMRRLRGRAAGAGLDNGGRGLETGDPYDLEPLVDEDELFQSISEWDWFELPQLAQLRRDVLVVEAVDR